MAELVPLSVKVLESGWSSGSSRRTILTCTVTNHGIATASGWRSYLYASTNPVWGAEATAVGGELWSTVALPSGQSMVITNYVSFPVSVEDKYLFYVVNASGDVVERTRTNNLWALELEPPIFAGPLSGQRLVAGQTLNLSAPALGWEPVSYQWYKDGAEVVGATNYVLIRPKVQLTDAGRYELVGRNPYGSARMPPVTVGVAVPLTVNSSFGRTNVAVGASLTLGVEPRGEGVLRYQWRLGGVNIIGATQSTLNLSSVQPEHGGLYQLLVASEAEVISVEVAEILVTVPVLLPGDRFVDQILLAGLSGYVRGNHLEATSDPGEPAHSGRPAQKSVWYAWQPPSSGLATLSTAGSSFDTVLAVYVGNDLSSLRPVVSDEDSGGFLKSLIRFNVLAGQTYLIVVDGYAGEEGSIVLGWNLEPTLELIPEFSREPASLLVAAGQTAAFTVEVTGGSLQWYREDRAIRGATNGHLLITNVGAADTGSYRVQAVNLQGTRTNWSPWARLELYRVDQGDAGP